MVEHGLLSLAVMEEVMEVEAEMEVAVVGEVIEMTRCNMC